jgi:hypothetical protein
MHKTPSHGYSFTPVQSESLTPNGKCPVDRNPEKRNSAASPMFATKRPGRYQTITTKKPLFPSCRCHHPANSSRRRPSFCSAYIGVPDVYLFRWNTAPGCWGPPNPRNSRETESRQRRFVPRHDFQTSAPHPSRVPFQRICRRCRSRHVGAHRLSIPIGRTLFFRPFQARAIAVPHRAFSTSACCARPRSGQI